MKLPRTLLLADKPEHGAKVAELTALLTKEMASHAAKFPLTVTNPKPAEWTPPAPGNNPARPAKKKPAASPAAPGLPTGRIQVDSALHFTNWDTNKDGFVTLEEFQLGKKSREVSKPSRMQWATKIPSRSRMPSSAGRDEGRRTTARADGSPR